MGAFTGDAGAMDNVPWWIPVLIAGVAGLGAGYLMGLESKARAVRRALATELLMTSLFTGMSRMTTLLLKAGADVNARDSGGLSALYHAACFYQGKDLLNDEQRAHDVFAQLLAAGADPTLKDHEGKTPLDRAREAGNAYAVARLEGPAPQP